MPGFPFNGPVNVVCAVPNIFVGVIYADDNQIREVHRWKKPDGEPECLIRSRSR